MMSSSASWCSSSETHSSAEHSTSRPRPAAAAGARGARWARAAGGTGAVPSLPEETPDPRPAGASSDTAQATQPQATQPRLSRRDSPAHRQHPPAPLHIPRRDAPGPAHPCSPAAGRGSACSPVPAPRAAAAGTGRVAPPRGPGPAEKTRGSVRPPRPGPAETRGSALPRSPGRRSPRPPPAWRPRAGAARPTGR